MEQIKVLLDLTFIKWQGFSGISNYAYNLVKGFMQYAQKDIYISVLMHKEFIPALIEQTGFNNDKRIIALDNSELSYLKKKYLKYLIPFPGNSRYAEFDIVISPYLNANTILFRNCHHIGVIHDLQHIQLAKERRNKFAYIRDIIFYKWLYSKLDSLITISDNTRKELMSFSGRNSTVIYNSLNVDSTSSNKPLTLKNESRPYILDVNSFNRYKNAETLIYAFNNVKDKIPHILYLKGNRNFHYYAILQAIVNNLELGDRIILDSENRSHAELTYLYKHASLFVSPSLMEGFGFTPIEAAINGTPVLVSDIPTLKEVTQNKVDYFNPTSIEELSQKILDILNTPQINKINRDILSHFFKECYSLKKQILSYMDVLKK